MYSWKRNGLLDLEPKPEDTALVSIDKVTAFKKWLEGK